MGDLLCISLFQLEYPGGGVDQDVLGHDLEHISVYLGLGVYTMQSVVEGKLVELVGFEHFYLLVA